MESLYKSKGKFGMLGREKRKESNKLRTQAKRQSIIAARRNMPLGELNDISSEFSNNLSHYKVLIFVLLFVQ